MHSKWLDAGVIISTFHYQSSRYDAIRPPAFGQYPDVDSLQMRHHEMMAPEELNNYLKSMEEGLRKRSSAENKTKRKRLASKDYYIPKNTGRITKHGISVSTKFEPQADSSSEADLVTRLDGGMKNPSKPSLFLQELAHLLSLLSAVALSTLRADVEGTESPLVDFVPGEAWPPVDPDTYSSQYRKAFAQESRCSNIVKYICGVSRNSKNRTLYNAARPFRVIGGVSEGECAMLQRARGPTAKVALCTLWLNEFVTKEHLHGM